MFAPFTDRARKALALANQEAQRLNHKCIGTEHILLGLVKEGSGVGATVLKNLGINIKKLRVEVEKLVQRGPDMVMPGSLPQTARAQKALEYAVEEARALNDNYVGTQHLLLGLLRDPEATAARALTNLGLKLEVVRAIVLELLGKPFEDERGSQKVITMRMPPSEDMKSPCASGRGLMARRFTDRARRVMFLANQEAQRLNHEYMETEHILLGLVMEGSGVGATVLQNLGVDIQKLRAEVEKLVKSGPDVVTLGKLPMTPRAKMVIEYAIQEAVTLNHNYVGTEHLVLGLLREGDGIAAQVLMNLGLTLEGVRREVLKLLGVGAQAEPTGPSVPCSGYFNPGAPQEGPASYKGLWAWQKADELAQQVYAGTNESARERIPGVVSRLRATALSIPPKIAEAHGREIRDDARWFLNSALASLRELRYLLDFAKRLEFFKAEECEKLESLASEVDGLLRLLYRNVSI
jgi:four helix bundle protein